MQVAPKGGQLGMKLRDVGKGAAAGPQLAGTGYRSGACPVSIER